MNHDSFILLGAASWLFVVLEMGKIFCIAWGRRGGCMWDDTTRMAMAEEVWDVRLV